MRCYCRLRGKLHVNVILGFGFVIEWFEAYTPLRPDLDIVCAAAWIADHATAPSSTTSSSRGSRVAPATAGQLTAPTPTTHVNSSTNQQRQARDLGVVGCRLLDSMMSRRCRHTVYVTVACQCLLCGFSGVLYDLAYACMGLGFDLNLSLAPLPLIPRAWACVQQWLGLPFVKLGTKMLPKRWRARALAWCPAEDMAACSSVLMRP